MQELIDTIVAQTGMAAEKTEAALGIIFNLIRAQGNQAKVRELFDALPGAEDLIAKSGSGGLMHKMAGGMTGGPMAAISKLQGLGLSMSEVKLLGSATLAYARSKAGDDVVRQAASNIPGLGGFL